MLRTALAGTVVCTPRLSVGLYGGYSSAITRIGIAEGNPFVAVKSIAFTVWQTPSTSQPCPTDVIGRIAADVRIIGRLIVITLILTCLQPCRISPAKGIPLRLITAGTGDEYRARAFGLCGRACRRIPFRKGSLYRTAVPGGARGRVSRCVCGG